MTTLENAIIKPGIEKHLVPLLGFKGHADLGRIHRAWNLTVSMMEHEAPTIGAGLRHLQHSGEYSHMCEPPAPMQNVGMYSFLSRLQAKPAVCDLHPGILDYARMLFPRPFHLCPVSEVSRDRRHAWWRTFEAPKVRVFRPNAAPLVYPFLIHDGGRPEHELLHLINAAVPRGIMGDLRADICQDLAVGVLCGDFPKEDLRLPAKEVIKRLRKMFPNKYGPMSLDAIIPGTDGLRLMDTI